MERLKFRVHPTFLIFAILLIYFGQGFLFVNYLIVIFLHEMTHAFVARELGYTIKNIKLIPFGICLNINESQMIAKDEIKIAIAGPLMNLFLTITTMTIWWLFPATYNYTYLFCCANFVTFMFNLLPAFPLDGGRVLLSLIRMKTTNKKAIRLCKIFNIILCVLLFICFIISCFFDINLTYLFVLFCILTGLNDKNREEKYTLINFLAIKKNKNIMKIKNLYVKEEEKIYKIYKYIDNSSYINLYLYDSQNKLKRIISETDYLELVENNNITTTFKLAKYHNKGTF